MTGQALRDEEMLAGVGGIIVGALVYGKLGPTHGRRKLAPKLSQLIGPSASSSPLVKLRFSASTSTSTAGSAASATAGRSRKKSRIKALDFIPPRRTEPIVKPPRA